MRRSLAVSESSPVRTTSARARAGGAQLGLRLLRERLGTRLVGDVERLAQELSRLRAPVAPPQQGAEVGECACSLHA